ncbi:MAG TPA: flagellar biosynthesis protein FliQ [Candidatus Atribacteria bacterium]|nr:flagellar biosynthesis protein FliQ [Candidatus Atribacteria bacterium]HPT78033.1 flagellar biosynthesis protein FliQ [Candidatus Atribacteria bacterium]
MSQEVAIDIIGDALKTTLTVSAPVLLIALVVGLVISILQATTQIQEQTLTFVPKILAVFISLIIFGTFIFKTLIAFTNRIFDYISNIVS